MSVNLGKVEYAHQPERNDNAEREGWKWKEHMVQERIAAKNIQRGYLRIRETDCILA